MLALSLVLVSGTVGYVLLGFGLLDAVYQTVTTVTTVGFREVKPLTAAGQIFTMVLILAGVGTALYTLGVLLEALIEGHLLQHMERRRMDRAIAQMTGHVIICGWGRVGRASARYLSATGQEVVVVDRDAGRLAGIGYPTVLGDVTDDEVLETAGITRARALIAALDTDADNVYGTLSARALRPDLVIIARARTQLKAIQGRPALKVAIGLTVPAIEAWYLVGREHQVGEAAWTIGLKAGRPPFTRPRLKELVPPMERVDPARLAALLADLDHDQFVRRQRAMEALAALDTAARDALQQHLATVSSAEARQRAAELLHRIDRQELTGEALRQARAVEALERAGTPAARAVLEELAQGQPGATLTRQAEAALGRMKK